MKPRKWEQMTGYGFVAPYLVLFSMFVLWPLMVGLKLSFTNQELASPGKPVFVGLSNFTEALKDEYFLKALGVTFKLVLLTVPPTVVAALLLATLLANQKGRSQQFFRAAIYLPGMLTISVVSVLWRWIFAPNYGVIEAMTSPAGVVFPWFGKPAWALAMITIITVWWTLGGPTIILLAGLKGIPSQYDEAAQIDGASSWMRFSKIKLPLLRPVLLFTVVMSTIGSFQIFGQTYMVTRGGPELSTRTLVQYIYETAFGNYRMGYAASMSWLLFAIIAMFSVAQFRLMRDRY